MYSVREPAVAGTFYPADPAELKNAVSALLNQTPRAAAPPKALIAPHAGYIYSGPIAASAYARIGAAAGRIHRVVLLGPAHRVPFEGLAAPSSAAFTSPLGEVAIDQAAIGSALEHPQVAVFDEAHTYEHSLEVQLPFLQIVLKDFLLVPLLVGRAGPAQVAAVLETLWGGEETLIVVSSDLSHYHSYAKAKAMDSATSRAIEALDFENIGYDDACGRDPIRGLLLLARKMGLSGQTIDLRNSGDTAGPRDRVVGYGAYALQ